MDMVLDERQIIEQVLQGNTNAYSILVDRYRNFVFTITLRYIPSREDAEEVAQDVFIKAFRSLRDFRGQAKFSTWLYTVTTTTCLSFLRKKKVIVHSLDQENVFARAANIAGATGAGHVEQKTRVQLVHDAMNMLNAEDARVLTLFYQGEQTLEEIATVLGKETNAVKVQLHRARGRLREKMEKHFPAEVKDIY